MDLLNIYQSKAEVFVALCWSFHENWELANAAPVVENGKLNCFWSWNSNWLTLVRCISGDPFAIRSFSASLGVARTPRNSIIIVCDIVLRLSDKPLLLYFIRAMRCAAFQFFVGVAGCSGCCLFKMQFIFFPTLKFRVFFFAFCAHASRATRRVRHSTRIRSTKNQAHVYISAFHFNASSLHKWHFLDELWSWSCERRKKTLHINQRE